MCVISRPSGLKYEKAKEWRIPCVNAQWLCDILLGNFEALRQIQHSRYTQFNLAEPLAPNTHLVQNLLGKVPRKQSDRLHVFVIGGFFPPKILKNVCTKKKIKSCDHILKNDVSVMVIYVQPGNLLPS